jgi:hypothetical protein
MEIKKGDNHSKIIGNFGENLVCDFLSRSGFEVALIDHTGIDIIAYNKETNKRLGITVKSRTREVGTEETHVSILKGADRKKVSDACSDFNWDPWIAVYIETEKYADLYLISLHDYDEKYGGGRTQKSVNWYMGRKAKERYENDPNVKYIHVEFIERNWNWQEESLF